MKKVVVLDRCWSQLVIVHELFLPLSVLTSEFKNKWGIFSRPYVVPGSNHVSCLIYNQVIWHNNCATILRIAIF